MCLSVPIPNDVVFYDDLEIDALVNLYFEHRIYCAEPASTFSSWLTDVFLNRNEEDIRRG